MNRRNHHTMFQMILEGSLWAGNHRGDFGLELDLE